MGFSVPVLARYSTCAMTMPPLFLAAWASGRHSISAPSFSRVRLPSSSAVVPRMIATSTGKVG